MAVAIVGGPLLIVVEDVVSFAYFLELILSGLVIRVLVGVILHREFAIGLLEIVRGGVPGDAEDLVIVALVSHE